MQEESSTKTSERHLDNHHHRCPNHTPHYIFVVFVTPEGFITTVANKGLEKARAYLNQVPGD